MSTQTLKDRNLRTIGYVETRSDGTQVLKNASYQIQGYYNPKSNETKNASYFVIGRGNLLTTLLKN